MYQATFPPKPRQHSVGVATTSILVDTPSSAVVDVAPKGSDTLGVRANVLASVMVDGDVKAEIAQAAGLNPADIVGVAKSGGTNQPVTTPASPKDPNAPVLTTQVLTDNTQDALPIIQVQAQAQDAASATKLANAAVVGLRNYLSTKAAAERIPDATAPPGQRARRLAGPHGLPGPEQDRRGDCDDRRVHPRLLRDPRRRRADP